MFYLNSVAENVMNVLAPYLIQGNKTPDGYIEIAGRLTNYDRWFCEELEADKGIYESMYPEPTEEVVVNRYEDFTCRTTEMYAFPDGSKILVRTTKDARCFAYDEEGHGINIYQNEKVWIKIM